MSFTRSLGAFLALLLLAMAAPSHAAQPPAPCTAGQKQLRLEPLQILTSKGFFRFQVEMAVTERTQNTGLMCRRSVAVDRGMLFDYARPQPVAFWMKNTLIPLDIIYIGVNGRVISIARNTTPLSEAPIPSYGVVRGVLELRGGRAEQIGLLPGDKVFHRIFPRA